MAATILAASNANAQIIYKDLIPDVVINPDQVFQIDLNNDSIYEFHISVDTFGIDPNGSNGELLFDMYMTNAFAYNGSRLLRNPGNPQHHPVVRELGYGVHVSASASSWDNYGHLASNVETQTSEAWENIEKYVGVKFRFEGVSGIHYGWIRLDVHTINPGDISITIKDWAYNSVKNEPILAGEGAVATLVCQEYEPNNSFANAVLINTNQSILSLISNATDKDFYQFNITADQPNLQLVLSGLPKNYDMILYNSFQQKIAKAKNLQKENDTIVYNNAAAGIYYVKVYQKDGLFDSTNCYNLNVETASTPFRISSADETADLIALNIFPNPATQFVNVQFDDELLNETPVSVFDLEGRMLLKIILPKGTSNSQIDVSLLPEGMYLIKAEADGQIAIRKFSISK